MLCMCMCIYICVCVRVNILCTYIMCVCARALTHVRICYTYIYTRIYTYVYARMYCFLVHMYSLLIFCMFMFPDRHTLPKLHISLHYSTVQESAPHYIPLHCSTSLVVSTPLKNMSSSVGMIIPNI